MRPRIGVPAGSTTEGHVLLCGGRIGGLCELPGALCWQACLVDHRGPRSTMRWCDRRLTWNPGGSTGGWAPTFSDPGARESETRADFLPDSEGKGSIAVSAKWFVCIPFVYEDLLRVGLYCNHYRISYSVQTIECRITFKYCLEFDGAAKRVGKILVHVILHCCSCLATSQ